MLFMILRATLRTWATDFDQPKPASRWFLAEPVLVIAIIAIFYLVMESRQRQTAVHPAP